MSNKTPTTTQAGYVTNRIARTNSRFRRNYSGLLASLGCAGFLLASAPALAQVLGAAQSFAILGGTAVTATAPAIIVNGDVGIAPAAASFITGFPANVTFTPPFSNHGNDATAIAARAATTTLATSSELAPAGGAAITANLSIGGPSANGVYTPQKYSLASGTAIIPTSITLDGAGTYIFSLSSDITTSVGSTVIFLNGANPCNVFWLVPTLATLNGVNFPGTVVAGTGVHLGTGSSLTGRALSAAAGNVTMAGGNNVGGCSAAAPLLPTMIVTKVSNGGVGTFSFTGNNGFAGQSITTVTTGVGVAGTVQTLTAAGVSTTITESAPPAGYTLTSIACTGLGTGGTQTPVIGTGTVTLDAAATAAGAAIACTFTNTLGAPPPPVLPTVTVTKVSTGGVGTFSFTGNNGFAGQSITTVTTGVGVAGTVQTLTAAGVSTTITEAAPPAGYTLTSIACTGLGTGGTQTPIIGTRTVTLDAAATAAGAAIACTFTNTLGAPPPPVLPTITVTKVSTGGVNTFSFTGTNGFAGQSITTVTTGVGVSGATQTLTAAGVSTTLTEAAPPTGYTLTSISCTGLGTGGTPTYSTGTRTVTLDAAATAAGAAIACTFTNTFSAKLPTVTVTKVSNGGVGSFSFTGNNGFAGQSITTVTTGVGLAGAAQTLTAAGVSTTITEAAPPAGYTLASISCTGLGTDGTATPSIGTRSVALDAAATAAGAAIACTFTNTFTAPLPPVASIPTLSEWALILLAALMAITGFVAMRRKEN